MLLTCFSDRTSLKGQRDSMSRADPIRRFGLVLSNLGLSTDLQPTPYSPKSRMRTPNAPESCRGGYAKQFEAGNTETRLTLRTYREVRFIAETLNLAT